MACLVLTQTAQVATFADLQLAHVLEKPPVPMQKQSS